MSPSSSIPKLAAVVAVAVVSLAGVAVAAAADRPAADRTAAGWLAAPVGACDWVDPAAVAELPVAAAIDELAELSTMSAAILAADLSETLEEGPFTIFGPSNDAFDEIPDNVFDSIIADPDLLSSIIGYHVVVGTAYSADDLAAAGTVETESGPLDVAVDGSEIVVDGGAATVTCAGIRTADATIFVIDGVLQPAADEIGVPGSSVPGSSVPGTSVPG